jgi:hypothetical protein
MKRQMKEEPQQEGPHQKANPKVHFFECQDENDEKNNSDFQ